MGTGWLPSQDIAQPSRDPKVENSKVSQKRVAARNHNKLRLGETLHLSERSHEWCNLAVVCCVHVGAGVHQELDHVEMTAISRQPQRSVPFLVSYVNMGPPAKTRQVSYRYSWTGGEAESIFGRNWDLIEIICQLEHAGEVFYLLMSSSQNL